MASGSFLCLSALQGIMAPAAWRFWRALATPEQAQQERLAAVVQAAAGSQQATRIPGFARLQTPREFQDAIPFSTYHTLAGEIEALAHGMPCILTSAPVLRFEKSGGSSGATKYVPYTRQLLGELHQALAPWFYDIWQQRPATRYGPGYWALSPIGQQREVTPGGIAVGTVDDTAYFPSILRPLLRYVMAVPGVLGLLPDIESCRYVTLRCLLDCPHLALVSVWHPSFLTLLMQSFGVHQERLLDDLAWGTCRPPLPPDASPVYQQTLLQVLQRLPWRANPQRARALRVQLRACPAVPVLWPHLSLLSMWTEAQAERFLTPVQEDFAGIEIQGKGLLATEGVVSIPLFAAPAPVLAIRSHFYEFLDSQSPASRPLLAHELTVGHTYEVVLSTGGGLLRYRLGDLVQVVGTFYRTPCVRFLGRADAVSDLVGEKLSAAWVSTVLARASQALTPDWRLTFVMLAPALTTPPAYHLYMESTAPDSVLQELAHRLETLCCASYPYRYARQLGQLGAIQAVRVEDAARRYERRCMALGQRAGDIKPLDLHRDCFWDAAFAGRLLRHHEAPV